MSPSPADSFPRQIRRGSRPCALSPTSLWFAGLALALPMTARSQQSATGTSEGEQVLRELVRVMNAGDRADAPPARRRAVRRRRHGRGSARAARRAVEQSPRGVRAACAAQRGREQGARGRGARAVRAHRVVASDDGVPGRVEPGARRPRRVRAGAGSRRAGAPAEPLTPEQVAEKLWAPTWTASRRGCLQRHGPPRQGAASRSTGGRRRPEPGLRRARHARHEVQPRLDEQDVHRRGRGAARGAGQALAGRPGLKYLGATGCRRTKKSKVRVRHLLTHTSGLGSYFKEACDKASRALYRTVEDWKPLVAGRDAAFEPGTQWEYSNTGMLLPAAVIEKAAGRTTSSTCASTHRAGRHDEHRSYELDKVNRKLAVGYEEARADGVDVPEQLFAHVVRGGPAGGGYSTVEDLLRFDEALRGGKLVRAESLEDRSGGRIRSWSRRLRARFRDREQSEAGSSGTRRVPGISAELTCTWTTGTRWRSCRTTAGRGDGRETRRGS